MSFEGALEAWVRKNTAWAIPEDAVELSGFSVRHEPGWSNDNGTYWPEDITITFYARKPSKTGKTMVNKKIETGPPHGDIVEFMRELLEEV